MDLIFASPEVTKNISSWEVLDMESLSDHRYIFTKLLGKQNQWRKYKTKGGWSLQRMNRDKFLQRISAANLESSATAEEAAEALMRAIADACGASMPRRPSTYHRKPAYWWNQELAGLRNDCNKRRRGFQRARKANRLNAIEEQEAYKEARRMLRIVIRKCEAESWKNLIETINSDPWGLPYKIVMDKLLWSQGSSMPEEESLQKIVEVLFPTGEPRTGFPNQEHREPEKQESSSAPKS